ncbi:MAG: MliC family protein [Patescibacteria group bacterium]
MEKNKIGVWVTVVIVVLLLAFGVYRTRLADVTNNQGDKATTTPEEALGLSIDELLAPVLTVNYECAGGKSFIARIEDRPVGAPAQAEIWLNINEKILLAKQVSTSGELYQNSDNTISFWIKGDSSSVEQNGQAVFADCRAGE